MRHLNPIRFVIGIVSLLHSAPTFAGSQQMQRPFYSEDGSLFTAIEAESISLVAVVDGDYKLLYDTVSKTRLVDVCVGDGIVPTDCFSDLRVLAEEHNSLGRITVRTDRHPFLPVAIGASLLSGNTIALSFSVDKTTLRVTVSKHNEPNQHFKEVLDDVLRTLEKIDTY